MQDLSLHILDVAENGVRAGAGKVAIEVRENTGANRLEIVIEDNGSGMDAEMVRRVEDPFFTSRTERKVGLGIPLFAQAARAAGGGLKIDSAPGKGTRVSAWFVRNHIDLKPMGDLAGTVTVLLAGNPGTEFRFLYEKDGEKFELETAEIRQQLGELPLSDPTVLNLLERKIRQGIQETAN